MGARRASQRVVHAARRALLSWSDAAATARLQRGLVNKFAARREKCAKADVLGAWFQLGREARVARKAADMAGRARDETLVSVVGDGAMKRQQWACGRCVVAG